MNQIQLYLFLKNSEVWEIQSFGEQYGLHLTKTEVKQLQSLLREIPFYELKWPLAKHHMKQIKSIIGPKKFEKLMELWESNSFQ